jgi:acetyl-CoA synthetase
VLKALAIQKGDRVGIYLPMIPEAIIAMLACARIGAIHLVVFGGFSSDALTARIVDADCRLVITANAGLRGGKVIPLKENLDQALRDCPDVKNVIVVKHTEHATTWHEERDIDYATAMSTAASECPYEHMDANDPLFILYTSGSTGKPKGIVHSTGRYLVYAAMTHQYIFNYQKGDVYWCTADVGWITGHTYIVYGPLANGATSVLFEGVPNYPTLSRCWEIVDKYQVNIFYTAPTALTHYDLKAISILTVPLVTHSQC